jgi:hypothetical protein
MTILKKIRIILNIIILSVFFIIIPNICLATNNDPVYFTPQISIPGSGFTKGIEYKIEENTKTIGTYITSIYNYLLAIVGLLSTIVLMAAGIIWMTAAGNTERISLAKNFIIGALTGLLLLLLSYILLKTINPNLVDFKPSDVNNIKKDFQFEIEEDELDQDTTGRDQFNPDTDPILKDIEECENRGENYRFDLRSGECYELVEDTTPQECPCPEGQEECIIDEVLYICSEYE